jgi:hypothetical protein
MTLVEFKELTVYDKIQVLYHHGTYIGKQRTWQKTVLLYQLEGFYVEIFYRKHRQYIDHFHCFTSTKHLDPYLEQIKIELFV